MTRVVIAEDDFRVAGLHEKFLHGIDHIEIAGKALNGEDTLKLVEEMQPDLLLLDVYMPDRLGTDLLHEIRQITNELDIIMITAATDKAMISQSLNYGVLDYIIKPISMDRFRSTIEAYQEKRKLIDQHRTLDQSLVDQLIGKQQTDPMRQPEPKGIDTITLKKVRKLLKDNASEGITAEQASDHMGASKTTARRYLEHLISVGEGKAETKYGKVGRPERKYFYKD
ncbi:response regulator [Halobacillus rhizosphaerae]|uniref:response regulator n=1 Tax=Halobacillus rhizosphaerae TaxID=3064889 RepID=UPI00398BB1EC